MTDLGGKKVGIINPNRFFLEQKERKRRGLGDRDRVIDRPAIVFGPGVVICLMLGVRISIRCTRDLWPPDSAVSV